MEKKGFEDFIVTADDANRNFVRNLHDAFIGAGCRIEVKEAKSGFVVSYLNNKKTVANYVFRKSGQFIRIYANHIEDYMDFLNTLPDGMIQKICDAPVCKRLINPSDCNPKCAKGYAFYLNGEHYQKCRNSAFMFLLCEENNPFIKTFIRNELEACLRTS